MSRCYACSQENCESQVHCDCWCHKEKALTATAVAPKTDVQTAYTRWVELRSLLEVAAKNRNWLEFDKLLETGKDIAAMGKLANLHEAVFEDEDTD